MVHRSYSVRSALALVVAAGTMSLGVQAPSSAAVAAPTAIAPAVSGNVSSNTPTFTWSRVTGAAKYELQTDADPNFGSPIKATTVNRRWVPNSALPGGENYWRVRAFDSGSSAGPWSNEINFSIATAAGPTLFPVTPTPLPQPSSPPLLHWTTVPRATAYEVEVATEPEFLVPVKATTSTTSYVVPTPAASEEYFWRVRGVLGSGIFTQWSDPGNYIIGDLATVQNSLPGDGELVEDVVLRWDPVPGAVYYDLRVGLDPDLNTWEEEVLNIRGTQYSPATTYNNNDGWYWKVRAVNAKGEKIPWANVELRTFQRQWLDKPSLVHPANVINPAHDDDFYYEWTPVQHASHYEIWVGTDPNFSPLTYEVCKTAGTTYTAGHFPDLCMPSQGQVYYWKVRAIDAPASPNVQGIFSDIHSFIYSSGPVQQIAPTDGESVAVPTLRWAAQNDVETYHVLVEGSGTYKMSVETYALSWTPNLDPTKGPFTWRVWAEDTNGFQSPIYGGRSFSISGEPADTSAAPLTPLTGIAADPGTVEFPSLSWEPMPDAKYYKIQIGFHGSGFWKNAGETPFLNAQFNYPAATDTGKVLISPPASYDWRVRAFDAANQPIVTGDTDGSGWGPVGTYTIKQLDAVTGQSIALTGSALDQNVECTRQLDDPATDPDICTQLPTTPVLDWNPVSGASHYMVYMAEERELTNLVYTTVARTVSTRWTPHLGHNPKVLPDNLANQAYYWIIRPCFAVGVCAPDPISTEAVATHAFTKVSPKVMLEAPAHGVTVTNGKMAFSWEDYLLTNSRAENRYLAPGQPADKAEYSNQTAQRYRIEVSETDTFGTLVDFAEVDQTSYSPWRKTYPEGQLYWRVQAIDAQGNRLSRSVVRTFTKRSPAPLLTSPVNDVTTNGLQAFRWQPSAHALSYTLEVYKNNDTTFSSGNKVFTCTTPQTACTFTKPFAASTQSYVWRVRWSDGDSRPGAWSAFGRFRSIGQPPGLLAPVASAFVGANDGFFTWTAPPSETGATFFRFERRLYGSSTIVETVTTSATAYAPTARISDGTWQWRVTALDANRQPLGTSAWAVFRTDGRIPTVISRSPLTYARVSANFRAQFSEPVKGVSGTTMRIFLKGRAAPLSARVTLSADRRWATLNPTRYLVRGRYYTVRLSNGITDMTGNRLVATSWRVRAR